MHTVKPYNAAKQRILQPRDFSNGSRQRSFRLGDSGNRIIKSINMIVFINKLVAFASSIGTLLSE
jgi:hypothetical protein